MCCDKHVFRAIIYFMFVVLLKYLTNLHLDTSFGFFFLSSSLKDESNKHLINS